MTVNKNKRIFQICLFAGILQKLAAPEPDDAAANVSRERYNGIFI